MSVRPDSMGRHRAQGRISHPSKPRARDRGRSKVGSGGAHPRQDSVRKLVQLSDVERGGRKAQDVPVTAELEAASSSVPDHGRRDPRILRN